MTNNERGSAPGRTRRAALIHFGCAKNLVDSEVMGGHLLSAGYEITGNPGAADVIVLNTCGFIRASRDEAESGIRSVLEIKEKRPEVRIVVAGCYSERNRAELTGRYPGVDAWFGVKDYDKIAAVAGNQRYVRGRRTFLYDHLSPRALSTPPGWAYLKISEGCSHECAFCAIPSIKGRYRSRSAASIVAEARALEARGVREIVLISQDTTYFGRDRDRRDGFPRLLEDLLRATTLPWIRFLYGYPEEITARLLETMSDPRICPYLDIPFQHAAPSVLKGMKRSMTAPRAFRLLDRIRIRLPEAVVRTSLIVGFPGEGRDEFELLRNFVREARFDHLGVFTYSPEVETPAAVLGDPVPEAEKNRRRSVLMELQAEISKDIQASRIGSRLDVLLESVRGSDSRDLVGRTRFQAPESDGVVFVRAAPTILESPLRRVKITSSGVYDLRGTLLS